MRFESLNLEPCSRPLFSRSSLFYIDSFQGWAEWWGIFACLPAFSAQFFALHCVAPFKV